jgi:c-di-GMP-binding flagellar brake protein YcgR
MATGLVTVITSAPTLVRKGAPRRSDALDRIDAATGPHEMRDPFDIGEALEALARTGEAVTVYPSAPASDLLLARIHSVDPEQPTFVLDFAGGVPPTGAVTLVASLGGNAKLQFELAQQWHGVPNQPNLVVAQFPPACMVLNRRSGQRVGTPLGLNYSAAFQLRGQHYELPLHDFSAGGVGLRATPEQAYSLRPGQKIEAVRLELGPALVLTVDLEIRLVRPFSTFLLGEQVQIGCSFAYIAMQMQQSLERFVTINAGKRRGA